VKRSVGIEIHFIHVRFPSYYYAWELRGLRKFLFRNSLMFLAPSMGIYFLFFFACFARKIFFVVPRELLGKQGAGCTRDPHPSLSRKAGEGKKAKWFEKFPRPFRWERARVRAISLFAGERKLMNHFVVSYFSQLDCGLPLGSSLLRFVQ
jgi:hypothetical protein